MIKRNRRRLLAATALLLTSLPIQSRAVLYVYEGFADADYPPNFPTAAPTESRILDGSGSSDSTRGFSAGWDDTADSPADADAVTGASLTFTHPGTGLSLSVSGRSVAIQTTNARTDSSNVRDIVNITGTTGTTLWISFLMQKVRTGSQPNDRGVIELIPTGLTNPRIEIGDASGSGNYSLVQANTPPTDPVTASSSIQVNSATAFLVTRLTFGVGATDVADLFVNPSPGLLAPVSPDATLSNLNIPAISLFAISASNQTAGTDYVFDEIRFGSTFADVAPVPEPTAAISLAFGSLCLLVRRRRRPHGSVSVGN